MNHRPRLSPAILWTCTWVLTFSGSGPSSAATRRSDEASRRPNVLFIAIDDLRNRLGCLGDAFARTPNLDRLAAGGRLFTRHYVQVPTCGASRCALLRGRYPEVPAHAGNGAILATGSMWAQESLPGRFQQHGYRTLALGKVTHYPGGRTGRLWSEEPEELPGVWTRCWIPESPWGAAQHIMHGYANGVARRSGRSPPWEAFDGGDDAYPDYWVAEEAVTTLKKLAEETRAAPWFFAVGFFKPHLPFAAPKRWYDLHDADAIPAPVAVERPGGVSSWHRSGEFRGNYGHEGRDPDDDPDYARLMRHGYAAATSYMDAQVGKVLDALDRLGLATNTVVVVWSDHGFLLGEHAMWGKHCLYEEALRSPLIIRLPGMARLGAATDALVQTVDLFPTLTDLCGLPVDEELHGTSLRPQLEDPAVRTGRAALGFWGRDQRTIRTKRWRLIVHGRMDGNPGVRGVELFDHEQDPYEATNVAEGNPGVVNELMERMERTQRLKAEG